MGIDEAGMNQPPLGRYRARLCRRRAAGRTQLADRVVFDQDVGRRGCAAAMSSTNPPRTTV